MKDTNSVRVDYVNLLRRQLNQSKLAIDSIEYIACIDRLEIVGKKIWNDFIQQRLDSSVCSDLITLSTRDHMFLESSIARVLGFGYEITYQLCSALIPEYSILKNGAVNGSILNFTISYYDMLCDNLNRPDEVDSLITPKYIVNALGGRFCFNNSSKDYDDVYIKFFKSLVELLFLQWKLLVTDSFNSVVIRDFHYSMMKTYYCHKALRTNVEYQKEDNFSIYYSWMKSCLPTWMMVELDILSQGYYFPTDNGLDKIRKVVFHFAEILWLLDDLIDIFEDDETNQFNIFLTPAGINLDTVSGHELENIAQMGMCEINNRVLKLEEVFNPKLFNNLFKMVGCVMKSWVG